MADVPETKHHFVDEAGDLTLFDRRGRVVIGGEGVSHCFFVGMVDLPDPVAAEASLESLRADLLADPYFRGVPSMQPSERKTALAFHAKNDLPEVRRAVMQLLPSLGGKVLVAFRRKAMLVEQARAHFEFTGEKISADAIYDRLVERVFHNQLHTAEAYRIVFARRGKANRNDALLHALTRARSGFLRKQGRSDEAKPISIRSTVPSQSAGLQVVDYYLWALQRLVEKREDRFFAALAPQYRLVMDLDDTRSKPYGEWYSDRNALTLERMKPVTAG